VYAKENGTLFNPKKISIYRVSFLRGQVKKRTDYPFNFRTEYRRIYTTEKKIVNWMGQSCCSSAYNVHTHTHMDGLLFLTFQLLTSSKENEPGRVLSDKAKEVLLLL
jgi:hypothetical protein